MAEFVAGYAQILQSKDISAFEVSERHEHFVSLMYFAQQFTWSAVLNFQGAVLLEIERGLIKWGPIRLCSWRVARCMATLYLTRLLSPRLSQVHQSLLLGCQFYFVGIINETPAAMPVIIMVTSVVNVSG